MRLLTILLQTPTKVYKCTQVVSTNFFATSAARLVATSA